MCAENVMEKFLPRPGAERARGESGACVVHIRRFFEGILPRSRARDVSDLQICIVDCHDSCTEYSIDGIFRRRSSSTYGEK